MHRCSRSVVHAHRLEGAGADVQGDVAELDAARAQRVQQRVVEMQAGGRRGDRAEFAREHGLVALVVVGARLALDVGRQRQAAGAQQPAFQRLGDVEAQPVELAVAAQHLGLAAGVERDARARLAATCWRRSARAPRRAGSRRSIRISTRPPLSFWPNRRAGITRVSLNTSRSPALQQSRQVADAAVREGARRRRHHQQAAGGALGQRRLRDQLRRQVVMEIGFLQGRRPS